MWFKKLPVVMESNGLGFNCPRCRTFRVSGTTYEGATKTRGARDKSVCTHCGTVWYTPAIDNLKRGSDA